MTLQLAIPMPEQPRRVRPEPMDLYEAILILRRKGHRVLRAGRTMHAVNGRRLPAAAIRQMARAISRGIG